MISKAFSDCNQVGTRSNSDTLGLIYYSEDHFFWATKSKVDQEIGLRQMNLQGYDI